MKSDCVRSTIRPSRLHANLDDSREEVKALKKELQLAKAEAKTDPMTRLANRRGFEDQLEALSVDPLTKDARHSLLIADIDKFKLINDTYGHIFGDKIIKVVAKTLDNLTKGKDIAARFGGEEFVVIMPQTGREGAGVEGERIRAVVADTPFDELPPGHQVTISAGVSILEHETMLNAEDLLRAADQALYEAKRSGKNRVVLAPEKGSQ